MQSTKDLFYGLARHPLDTLAYMFTCFSVIFTLVKISVQFFPAFKIQGPLPLLVGVLISIGWGANKVWKPSKISIKIANCNTAIEVLFGDIFDQDGIRAIAVGEFFESQLGKPVSDQSLHGAFIQRCFGGYPAALDAQLDEQLNSTLCTNVSKAEGKTKCYPIGTTALVKVNNDCYILFALTHADHNTLKASSSVELMSRALHKLLQRARNECGGHPLNLPLVGSGLSGLGLPTRDLLNLLILTAITETKTREVTQTIRIVLVRKRFEDVDLREVKQHWKD